MLTGSFPFSYDMVKDNSMNTATLYQRTLQKGSWKRREVLSDLPEPVLKLLKGMLAPKEDKRYTLQDIITHGWFDIDLEQGAFANNDLLVSQQQQNAQEDTFTAANIEQQMIEMLGPKLGARRRFAQT
jgi:serine/threonine protein kinase